MTNEQAAPLLKQAAAVLPHVQAAIAAQVTLWDACREVERAIGCDLIGLDDYICQLANCASPASVKAADVALMILGLEVDA